MEILKFNIYGNTAFFRNNTINDNNITFSYGHIHYVALKGLLGAVLGLGGHNESYMDKNYVHPKFYEKLRDVKCAIVPVKKYDLHNGNCIYLPQYYFARKKQTFTNNCGLSKGIKKGTSQTLVYIEQWLENVSWDIYILLDTIKDSNLRENLIEYITESKSVYQPYLGKTNHSAIITNPEIISGVPVGETEFKVTGLFQNNAIVEEVLLQDIDVQNIVEYKEFLPLSYAKNSCLYKTCLMDISNKYFEFDIDNFLFVKIKDTNIILNFN